MVDLSVCLAHPDGSVLFFFDGCLVIMQKAVSKHTVAAVLGIIITVER